MQHADGSKKEVTLLDAKRSNAINIGLTTLPPARTIRTAIFKMDSTIIGREQIEVYRVTSAVRSVTLNLAKFSEVAK